MTTSVEKRKCKTCGEYKQTETEISRLGRYCFTCQLKTKEEWREKSKAKQYGYHQAWKERLRADPAKYQEYLEGDRARRRKRMENPEYRLMENENQRIARRKKWEEQGRTLKPVSIEHYRRYNKTPRVEVPVAPILPFLVQWLTDHTQSSLSKQSGVPERRIYDYIHVQENASRISIEKLCHAMGITLDLVYDQSDDLEEILDDGDLCA